jgi:hypothetical protein
MAVNLELISPHPPAAVLEAIRARAGYWQESLVPTDLRRAGAQGVQVRIKGQQFRLAIKSSWEPQPTEYVLTGEVHARPEGGSRIRATAALGGSHAVDLAIGAALLALFAWGGRIWFGVMLVAVGGFVEWLHLRRLMALTLDADGGIQHLAGRLEAALRELGKPSVPSAI